MASWVSLFDRKADPVEVRDVSKTQADDFRVYRREIELFQDLVDGEWARLRVALSGIPAPQKLGPEACERLKALGYVPAGCS